jgi:microcystin-dependent protein
MATVTGLTKERMIAMENATVISGHITGPNLILVTRDGTNINAGSVIGPVGPAGPTFIVCTSTTRPAVVAADEGKAIYEKDTKLVRIWTGTRWKLQEKVICTSTTRPAGLVAADEGVFIYETDTDLEYVWSGTAWLPSTSYVAKFADPTDRSTKWPAPPSGALSYLANSPATVWVYEAGMWNSVGLPPGVCAPWLGTTAPLNYVLMFGQLINNAKTLYPTLWANVDPTWKQDPNLLVPDLRGRIPIGKDNMGGAASNRVTAGGSGVNAGVMGAVGGNEYMQSHTHTQDQHSGYSLGLATGTGPDRAGPLDHVDSVGYAGSGASQNVQPSIVLNWILKVV